MSDPFKYPGNELELFQHAKHWKKYFSKQVRPFIKGNVLEVGAGIGSTTSLLNDGSAKQWLMLEPDEQMSNVLRGKLKDLPSNSTVQSGSIDSVKEKFDTIIYIDVLEHIENDSTEVNKAADLLQEDGHIIILAPAFQSLFSPFDKAIGHYRRYNRQLLKAIKPKDLKIISTRYYDSMGYFASLMNKFFLKQKYPSLKQILFWDKWMVTLSTITDKLFFHSFGKSIITIWKKLN
ncbi:MAG: class I SAM-dependent methyltransferase [Chitinophagaceae bacterium]|nr:class I SAM-dependent methyltransferase [Chitinophagaceae bacterium]